MIVSITSLQKSSYSQVASVSASYSQVSVDGTPALLAAIFWLWDNGDFILWDNGDRMRQ